MDIEKIEKELNKEQEGSTKKKIELTPAQKAKLRENMLKARQALKKQREEERLKKLQEQKPKTSGDWIGGHKL